MPLLCCRQRDTEIAALRATLSERDSKLQDSRSELAELHAQIKDSEDGLQQAYNQLAEASRDRARVRQQLLQNQAELSGVRHSAMSATLVASESFVGHKTLIPRLTITWTDSTLLCLVHVVMQMTLAGVNHVLS